MKKQQEKATVRKDESENPVTPTERQRLKDEFDIHVEALWSTITCDVKDTLMVEKGLPSQEMERHFGLLREMCKTLPHLVHALCVHVFSTLFSWPVFYVNTCFTGRAP